MKISQRDKEEENEKDKARNLVGGIDKQKETENQSVKKKRVIKKKRTEIYWLKKGKDPTSRAFIVPILS